jgi:hypothetical protein
VNRRTCSARLGKAAALLVGLTVLGCSNPPPDPDDVGARPGGNGGAGSSGRGGSGSGGSGGGGTSGGTSATGGASASGGAGNPGGAGGSGSGGSGSGGSGSGAGGVGGAGGGPGGTGGTRSDGPAPLPGDGSAETPAGTGGTGGTGGSGGKPLPPGVQGHPNPAASYPEYPNFTLALVEEFDQPMDLDRDPIWTWSDGGLPEGGVRFFKDAISFADGKMLITVRRQNAPGSNSYAEPVADGDVGFVPAKPLRSGELRTKLNNYRYGRYEVRLKPPAGNGNFISTLFVFRTPKFEDWREIDIELTADRPSGVVTNLIYANNVGGWNPDIQELGDQFPAGPGTRALPAGFTHQGQFHTYAFEWLPDRITWFVDDVPVRVKMGGRLPIPEKSAKIIMNLWVFAIAGGFGGDPTRNQYPMAAEYEWFRFYRWNQDNRYPCADTPGCLPAEDRNKSKNNPDDGLQP